MSSVKEQLLSLGFDKETVEFAIKNGDSLDVCLNICFGMTDGDSSSSSPSSIGVCETCTYVNPPGASVCEMCNTPLETPLSKSQPTLPRQVLPLFGPQPPADWVDFKILKSNPGWSECCIFLYQRLLRPEEEVIPAAITGSGKTGIEYKSIEFKDIGRIFRQYVKNFDKIMDRLNTQPALRLIEITYQSGIPQLNQRALVIHSRECLRYILGLASTDPTLHWKRYLTRVAEAFSACQAEQARVLDAVYGELAGRDKGLIQQIDAFVANKKHVLLEDLVQTLNPISKSPTAPPSEQIPHLMNAYIKEVGTELGIRGAAAAATDHCIRSLTDVERKKILTEFRRTFSIIELAKDVINDVNQQAKDSDRLIDLSVLMAWAGDASVNNGFPSHAIFFDETAPTGTYGDDPKDNTKPTAENKFSPFLSNHAGILVLYHLYMDKKKS